MTTQPSTNCNSLNWAISKSRYFFNNGSLGNYHQWIFRGMLPEKMVKEIRSYLVAQENCWETGIYSYLLRVDGFDFSLKLPFGHKQYEVVIDITKEA